MNVIYVGNTEYIINLVTSPYDTIHTDVSLILLGAVTAFILT